MSLTTLKPRLASIDTRRVKQTMAAGSWRTDKAGSTERGYGYKWQQARAGHLRNSPLCVMCEREGFVVLATVVDHSIAHRGDMALFWDASKWQSLCANHHNSEAQRRDNAG